MGNTEKKTGKTRIKVRVRYTEFQKQIKGVKVGTGNRNVTENNSGLYKQKWNKGGFR